MNAGLTLLTALALEVALIVAFVYACQRAARSAVWQRNLWQVALVSIALVFLGELSGVNRGLLQSARPAAVAPPIQAQRTPPTPTIAPQHHDAVAPPALPAPSSPSRHHSTTPSLHYSAPLAATAPPSRWWPILVWPLGSALLLLLLLARHAACLVWRWRGVRPAPDELRNRVQSLARAAGLRGAIRTVHSARLIAPVAFGFLRRAIGLPLDFETRFTRAQQEAILMHELAHLAARDGWWYLAADMLVAALWWHPLVWFARRQLHSASEAAADESSLALANGPATLAECLVQVGAQLAPSGAFNRLGIGGSGFRSQLGRRVERLLHLEPRAWRPARRRDSLLKFVVPLALLPVCLLCTAWLHPQSSGESAMKTLRQNWKNSALALALSAFAVVNAEADDPAQPRNADSDALHLRVVHLKYRLADDALQLVKPTLVPGSRAVADERTNSLLIHAPESEWQRINPLLAKLDVAQAAPTAPVAPAAPTPPATAPAPKAPKPAAPAKARAPSPAPSDRRAIEFKLENAVFQEVFFDGLPLSEVIHYLMDESRKLDPDKEGVNFMIPAPRNTSAAKDPAASEPLDLNNVTIKLNPPLRRVRMIDALDAICKGADQPITYSITDYAVLFEPERPASLELTARTFQISPADLVRGLREVYELSNPDYLNPNGQARFLLEQLGISASKPNLVRYNAENGTLMVRATPAELDIITAAVEMLSSNTPKPRSMRPAPPPPPAAPPSAQPRSSSPF
ncbi:MAG: M56 family metallopeptidase [Verrucomicrobiota bacterium]